jgi:hypothetical protein
MTDYKLLKIRVLILATGKRGLIISRQVDFWNRVYFLVKVGRDIQPYLIEEFKYLNHSTLE